MDNRDKKHVSDKNRFDAKNKGKSFSDRKNKGKFNNDNKFKNSKFAAKKNERSHGRFDKSRERKEVSLSRLAAFDALNDITMKSAYTSLAIDDAFWRNKKITDDDKRLTTSIVYNTVENLIKIDYIINKFMEHPTDDERLRNVLRLSVAQIFYMDKVPDFASINEGVLLIKKVSKVEAFSKLVNAVLRNIVRSKDNIDFPKESEEPIKYLSINYSMPEWLVKKMIDSFGYDRAKQIISYRNTDNRVCIRPNTLNISNEKFENLLVSKSWKYDKGLLENAYLIKNISQISKDEDYRKGLFSVQGQSSMLAAMALENKPGMFVLDACAAPGGKTMYIAEEQMGTGRVYAWDIHDHRVELIRKQMYRLSPGNVRVSVCDASKKRDELVEFFDRVLIDAPCSNLGVVLEKPDVKIKLDENYADSLLHIQYSILDNCAQYLKKGGILVYSTCSILPDENDMQIERFLKEHKNFKLIDMPDSFPKDFRVSEGKFGITILPCDTGLEGFYISRLVKDE